MCPRERSVYLHAYLTRHSSLENIQCVHWYDSASSVQCFKTPCVLLPTNVATPTPLLETSDFPRMQQLKCYHQDYQALVLRPVPVLMGQFSWHMLF